MLDVINRFSEINALASADAQKLICRAEQRYDDLIAQIAEHINKNPSIEVVLLAGPSSSGKTTTAKKIQQKLGYLGHKAYTISLDDFYRHAKDAIIDKNGKPDFETVYALDLDLLNKVFAELVTNRRSVIPKYDFDLGVRFDDDRELILNEGDVVIVEGLHALNPIVYEKLPAESMLRLYVSVSTRIYKTADEVCLTKRDIRLIRRSIRDFQFRNSPIENTLEMWNDVLSGEQKYLAPYKYCADIQVDSFHSYEPCAFRDEAIALFSSVKEESPWRYKAGEIIKALTLFNAIPSASVPEDSLLREFLGNK